MNSLSWTLYAIEIISNIDMVLTFTFAASGVLVGFGLFGYFGCDDPDFTDPKNIAIFKRIFTAFVISTCLAIVLPSRKTMMLIAASEYGQSVYQDNIDLIDPAKKLLKKYIDEQLKDGKK